ncbi:helix-turn-helix transcriptional regulator [Bacillus sp. RG28]|uniref:Helix-turn-helix transcriptional regulator n=1 Tax=Gottfriedia endophytica TaxID=2820819 RepID=A0A940NWU5_9BACI|nr:helix-turn-helix transcriptional regulator [Gottfriedia endophytica]
MDIQKDFGLRVKELRARCGMSQEVLAIHANLDRSYIGGVERGTRNISLQNIEKITNALNVSLSYFFSEERFSTEPAYLQKDFKIPFSERFKYHIDRDKKILSFQVTNLVTEDEVDFITASLSKIWLTFKEGDLNIFVDHREMKDSNSEVAVFSPEVAKKSLILQQKLLPYTNKAVILCNSEFMVNQLNFLTKVSGVYDKSHHLFGENKNMFGEAYQLLEIHGHEMIKE